MKKFIDAVLKTIGELVVFLAFIAWIGILIWCTVEIWRSDIPRIAAIVVLWRFWVRKKKGWT